MDYWHYVPVYDAKGIYANIYDGDIHTRDRKISHTLHTIESTNDHERRRRPHGSIGKWEDGKCLTAHAGFWRLFFPFHICIFDLFNVSERSIDTQQRMVFFEMLLRWLWEDDFGIRGVSM